MAGKIKNLLTREQIDKHPKIESALVQLTALADEKKAQALQEYAQFHDITMTDKKVQVVVKLKQPEKDLSFLAKKYNLSEHKGTRTQGDSSFVLLKAAGRSNADRPAFSFPAGTQGDSS